MSTENISTLKTPQASPETDSLRGAFLRETSSLDEMPPESSSREESSARDLLVDSKK